MTYVICTPPIYEADAEALGQALATYAIHIRDLRVWAIYRDGSRHRLSAAERTVKQVAGNSVVGGVIGVAAAPVLGPLVAAIALPGLLASILGWLATVRRLYQVNQRVYDSKAVSGEINFDFGDVTVRRRGWAEYLLGAYCQLHGWQSTGGRQLATGAAYARRRKRLPPAWQAAR